MFLKKQKSIYSAVLLSFCGALTLQSNFTYAFSLSVGTKGVQLSHDFPINEQSNLYLVPSISYLQYKKENIHVGKVNMDAKLHMLNVGTELKFYPSQKSNHYISAGLYYNDMNIKGDGRSTFNTNNIKINTNTNVKATYNKVAPYIGFGYQKRKNDDVTIKQNKVSLGYNIGVLYVGKANIQYGNYCMELLNSCMSENDLKNKIAAFGSKKMYRNAVKQLDNYKQAVEHKTKHQFVPMVNLSIQF